MADCYLCGAWISRGMASDRARLPRVMGRQPKEAPHWAVTCRTKARAARVVAPTTSVSRAFPPAASQAEARARRVSARGDERMAAGTVKGG